MKEHRIQWETIKEGKRAGWQRCGCEQCKAIRAGKAPAPASK